MGTEAYSRLERLEDELREGIDKQKELEADRDAKTHALSELNGIDVQKYEKKIIDLEEDNKRLQDLYDSGQSEIERLLAGKDKEVSELAARCSSQCDELEKCKLLLEEAEKETQRLEKDSHNRKDMMRRRI